MARSNNLDEATRSEWAVLGFFYEYDEPGRAWRIRASHEGVGRLTSELRKFAQDPGNITISEHEHYGPYGFLKFVTWTEPKILPEGIYGRPDDFERLAEIIATSTRSLNVGDHVVVDQVYSSRNEASLHIAVEPEGFDVCSADTTIRTVPIHRGINGYDPASERLVDEQELSGIELTYLRHVLRVPENDQLLESVRLTSDHLQQLRPFMARDAAPDLEYFLECWRD